MSNLKEIELEYVYITVPAEYICVYHRILAMLADYGEEMLKDCKAACKDRNSGVIECFNMFNAAVAARKLGDEKHLKLAETIIKYVKAKINQIYNGKDNSTSFVFPVDENGQLKAFVSCGKNPRFWIDPDDGELYEHKFDDKFDEHFRLGPEDVSPEGSANLLNNQLVGEHPLKGNMVVRYELQNGEYVPCADIVVTFDGTPVNINNTDYQYYFDGRPVKRFNDVHNLTVGNHNFKCVVNYNGYTVIIEAEARYEN